MGSDWPVEHWWYVIYRQQHDFQKPGKLVMNRLECNVTEQNIQYRPFSLHLPHKSQRKANAH